jgi:Brp/Blh family beta-carotene 15,15'-monooxygenase
MLSTQQPRLQHPRSGTGPTGGDGHCLALQQLSWLTWLPIGLMSMLLVAAVAAPAATRSLALPLAIAGSLIGLPHGAVDHLVPRWVAGRGPASSPLARGPIALVTAGYAVVAGAALASMLLLPAATLAVFLIVSAGHFGWGEVETSASRAGRESPAVAREWPIAAASGLLVVGSLIWLRPSQTGQLAARLSPALERDTMATRSPGLLIVVAAVALGLGTLLWRARYLEAAELALLASTFAIVPPLAAFGLYFGGWHSVRHLGRLLDLAAARGIAGRAPRGRSADWPAAAGALLRAGWLPALVGYVGVVALWQARDRVALDAELAVLLALTFPHVVAVRTLDRSGGLR